MDSEFLKKNKWILLASGAAATLTAAYIVYGLSSYKECPENSASHAKKTPFHSVVKWDVNQEDKEMLARAWMEKYVRSVLLKGAKSEKSSQKSQNEEGTTPRQRADSLEREGTGRFQNVDEALRTFIATEKGLLKADDFEHVQKVIEVYSKALLCETRQAHLEERHVSFKAKNWKQYVELVLRQQAKEVKIFNKATLEILNLAHIKTSTFNQSIELFLISSEDSMLSSAKLSLYSPFVVDEQHKSISVDQARDMLNESTSAALDLLRTPELSSLVSHESELLLFFDSLLQDYVYAVKEGMNADQFRAVIFKYNLQDTDDTLENVCQQLYELAALLKPEDL